MRGHARDMRWAEGRRGTRDAREDWRYALGHGTIGSGSEMKEVVSPKKTQGAPGTKQGRQRDPSECVGVAYLRVGTDCSRLFTVAPCPESPAAASQLLFKEQYEPTSREAVPLRWS